MTCTQLETCAVLFLRTAGKGRHATKRKWYRKIRTEPCGLRRSNHSGLRDSRAASGCANQSSEFAALRSAARAAAAGSGDGADRFSEQYHRTERPERHFDRPAEYTTQGEDISHAVTKCH